MGLLPLTAVVTFFVMGMWALAEAFVDVRCLLNGGKVPLVKAVSDWQLSLEGVLKIGAEGKLPDLGENITVWGNETADESRSGSKKGLDLTGYLRMFLFVSYGSEPLFRMMDMMQMNIKKNSRISCWKSVSVWWMQKLDFVENQYFFHLDRGKL